MGKTNFLKKYFSLLIGILVSTALFASAPDTLWTRTYGGIKWDEGRSVQQTKDGGFIVAGWTASFGTGTDVYLIKTNSSGDTLWTKTYGGPYGDAGFSVRQIQDSGFIIVGNTYSFGAGNWDVYLIRTNSSGDTLWTKTFGGIGYDGGSSIQQTSDGGFIIAGSTTSFVLGNYDVYLIKINSFGDTLWTKTFGGTKEDAGSSVQQTEDKGFIIVGETYSFGAGYEDVYLIKTDSLGNTLWTKTYGRAASLDEGCSVQQTQDGGFIIAGYIPPLGANQRDVYLIKTNSSGDTIWTRTFGGTADSEEGWSVQQTESGGFIIAGLTYSFGAGGKDVYLIRTDSSGDSLWTKTFGSFGDDYAYSVQQTKDGGFIITGGTYVGGGEGNNYDVYLIRLGKETGIEEKLNIKNQILKLEIGENPITNIANISYTIPYQCKVELNIYDLTGSCVKTLVGGEKEAGIYSISLNAKELKAGVYFVRLNAGNQTVVKKTILLK